MERLRPLSHGPLRNRTGIADIPGTRTTGFPGQRTTGVSDTRTTRFPGQRTARFSGTGTAGLRRMGIAGLAVTAALLGAGCDSVSGIPVDEPARAQSDSSGASDTTATTTSAATEPHTGTAAATLPPVPADAPEVGAVPGKPEATDPVRRFAADLRAGDIAVLQSRCWTIPPRTAESMYADPAAALTALAEPGTAEDGRITWTDGSTTVVVDEDDLTGGYACGRVYPAGVTPVQDAADARHVVRRYLARATGNPLDPADREAEHPLLCPATLTTWDPDATGIPTTAPLAGKPDTLTGITAFDDQGLTSETHPGGYITVRASVTDTTGGTRPRTFTLTASEGGYCIGAIAP